MRYVRDEAVAVQYRCVPEMGTGLQLPDVGNDFVVLGPGQNDLPACGSVLFFQITIAPSGFGWDRHDMAQYVGNRTVRRRVKARDLGIDYFPGSVQAPKNRVSVAVAEGVAGAELDEVPLFVSLRHSSGSLRHSSAIGKRYEIRLGRQVLRLTCRCRERQQDHKQETAIYKRHRRFPSYNFTGPELHEARTYQA
jgi:hypothetical protein